MSAVSVTGSIAAGRTEPLGALRDALTFSSNDWSSSQDFAWIYGITVGWDGPAMLELAGKFGWNGEKIIQLRSLRRAYRRLQLEEERRASARKAKSV